MKTIKNSNQYVENKITKIKNDLNVAQQNISFVHHRMVHIQEKTSNFVAKEIKNVLNNTDYVDEYSNIIVNKISNISNNQTVKALLSLVTNEEQLNNIYTVLRQSNINTSNIKNLVDILNYSKNNNLEITKNMNIIDIFSIYNIDNFYSLVDLKINLYDIIENNINKITGLSKKEQENLLKFYSILKKKYTDELDIEKIINNEYYKVKSNLLIATETINTSSYNETTNSLSFNNI